MINKSIDSKCLLPKIDSALLIKTLQKTLASILFLLSKISKKLDKKVIVLIKTTDIAIYISISKAKLYAKSISDLTKTVKMLK